MRLHTTSTLALVAAVALVTSGCALIGSPPPGADLGPGIHAGKDATFRVNHDFAVDVPEGTKTVRGWFPQPNPNDSMQEIDGFTIEGPSFPHESGVAYDQWGNPFIYFEAQNPPAGSFELKTSFTVTRREVKAETDPDKTRPHTAAELAALGSYLVPSSQSKPNDDIVAMAKTAVGDEDNPVRAARAIYDAVLDRVEYHVKDPKAEKTWGSTGTGSSVVCFETCHGNCTDFHSLYAAASRSVGIPTRAVYGSFFKGPLDGADKDQSYHCWIEFHAPEIGWIPLDVAVADIFVADFQANEHSKPRANLTVADGYSGPDPEMVDYYFGNLEERRVSWHWGRDLMLGQESGPLLWNPKGHVEFDGEAGKVVRKLTYSQKR